MTQDIETYLNSTTWPFEVAKKLVKRFDKKPPAKGYALFETGYGPSGLPHIGTFGEVVRTMMVKTAFERMSDIPTRLIVFSDDLDGMRRAPSNVPNSDDLKRWVDYPLTSVPDPFGTHQSFGHHNNARLRGFLDSFGFEYEFESATEFYKSGRFNDTLLRACERYDEIMTVMLSNLGQERQETYSCFLPIHPETGKVLYVPIRSVDASNGMITYADDDGSEITQSVLDGNVKLQWKPDFGARWAALDVDFEMFGKDHSTNAKIYDRICEILGGKAPEHYVFELFLDHEGKKISKSKGNGLAVEEWLAYAPQETLAYFMYQKPHAAKKLHLGMLAKTVDDYYKDVEDYHAKGEQNPDSAVWHVHSGDVPRHDLPLGYQTLINLAVVAGADDPEVLWEMIEKRTPDARGGGYPELERLVPLACRYFAEQEGPKRARRQPDEREAAAILDLADRIESGFTDASAAEEMQAVVYQVGKDHGFEPLRDWFRGLYEVILGTDQGPRFGNLIEAYGTEKTVKLLRESAEMIPDPLNGMSS